MRISLIGFTSLLRPSKPGPWEWGYHDVGWLLQYGGLKRGWWGVRFGVQVGKCPRPYIEALNSAVCKH